MKISSFAQKYGLPPSTIRYYIQIGLLVPHNINGIYHFNTDDEIDMEIITDLKRWQFSLDDISSVIAEKRISRETACTHNDRFINLLSAYQLRLKQQKNNIERNIDEIDKLIKAEQSTEYPSSPKKELGVRVEFLPLLYCPDCQKMLNISPDRILNGHILNAELSCECGYNAHIKDGILNIPSRTDINNYGTQPEYWAYNNLSPHEVTSIYKTYHWLADKLFTTDLSGKIILENIAGSFCFLFSQYKQFPPQALYIISDRNLSVINMYKERADKMPGLPHILFIAGDDVHLPVKPEAVDFYLDLFKNTIFSTFNQSPIIPYILPYLHKNSIIAGAFTFVSPTSKSLKIYKENYLNSYMYNNNLQHFLNVLEENHISVDHNYCDDPMTRSSIPWHLDGDELRHFCYVGKVKQKNSL